MKLYKNYLIKNLFKPFIVSLTTLVVVIWSTRIIRYMSYVVEDGAKFSSFFKLTLYVLPSLILAILPLSIFLTAILTYNKLIENREIVILKNCGIKKIQIISPLIILSIFISFFSYFLTFYGSYKSNLALRELRTNVQNNISFSIIKEGVFSEFKNLVVYVDKKEKNSVFNIIIYKRSENLKDKYDLILQAEKANINANVITLYNGNFQRFNNDNKKNPDILFFDKYNFDFNDINPKQTRKINRLDSISTIKIVNILRNFDKNKNLYKKNKVIYEVNYRFSFPLVVIIMALISGSLMLEGAFNRTSNYKIILKTSIISVISYISLLSLYQKVSDNIIYLYILYIFIFILLISCFWLIKEKKSL